MRAFEYNDLEADVRRAIEGKLGELHDQLSLARSGFNLLTQSTDGKMRLEIIDDQVHDLSVDVQYSTSHMPGLVKVFWPEKIVVIERSAQRLADLKFTIHCLSNIKNRNETPVCGPMNQTVQDYLCHCASTCAIQADHAMGEILDTISSILNS